MKKKYVIYTPDYNEYSGGIIMLHYLCHLLNQNGYDAYLWRLRPEKIFWRNGVNIKGWVMYHVNTLLNIPMATNAKFNTPIAERDDLKNSIVVYPDIVLGNPLNAQNIVRWFLHKPGNHLGSEQFSKDGLLFYFREQFNTMDLDKTRCLKLTYLRNDVYKNLGIKGRKGTCHILHKAKKRKVVHDLKNSILIDGRSHKEVAKIFNKVKYCISYDSYTMYNKYAAICGCIVILIPEDGVSKEEWMPNEEDRYGIAYGFDDEQYSIDTRNLVIDYFIKIQNASNEKISNFIRLTQSHFA